MAGLQILSSTANVKWIAPFSDETRSTDAVGYYTYQTTFTLPATTYISVTIPVSYYQDDYVSQIVLNGVTLYSGGGGASSCCNVLTDFNLVSGYSSSFVLSVTVNNVVGNSGLYLQFGNPIYAIATVGPQSTGMSGAIGTLDTNWLITSTPAGATNAHPYICIPNSVWNANTAAVKWIAPSPDETLSLDTGGYYTYQTTFTLPVTTYTSVTIPVFYYQDDYVSQIVLNGVVICIR